MKIGDKVRALRNFGSPGEPPEVKKGDIGFVKELGPAGTTLFNVEFPDNRNKYNNVPIWGIGYVADRDWNDIEPL